MAYKVRRNNVRREGEQFPAGLCVPNISPMSAQLGPAQPQAVGHHKDAAEGHRARRNHRVELPLGPSKGTSTPAAIGMAATL